MGDFENQFDAFKEFVNELTKTFKYGRKNIALEKVEKGDQYTFSKKVDYPFDYQALKTDIIKFSNTEATEDIIKGINSFGMSGHGESIEVNFDDEKEVVVITIKKAESSIEKKQKCLSYSLSGQESIIYFILIVKEIEMEQDETEETIDLLLKQVDRLQVRVTRLETIIDIMAIMLGAVPEKEDTD